MMIKILMLLVLLFTTLLNGLGSFYRNQQSTDTEKERVSGVKLEQIEAIFDDVKELRELSSELPENIYSLTEQQIKSEITDAFEEFDNKESEQQIEILQLLGLIDEFTFKDKIEYLTSQVAGYYDSEVDNLVILRKSDPSEPLSYFEQVTMAHELVHALQNKNFDLNRFESIQPFSLKDRDIALIAAIEGDATLFMNRFISKNPPEDISEVMEDVGEIPEGPEITEEYLYFPYTEGLTFTTYIDREGGLELINQSILEPPRTTEQILHPQKYIDQEDPVELSYRPTGTPEYSITLGEIGVSFFLDMHGISNADKCAAGWGNDTIYLYQDSAKWILGWDTTEDFEEAERCFADSVEELEEKDIELDINTADGELIATFTRK